MRKGEKGAYRITQRKQVENKKRTQREKGAHMERTNRKPVEIKELIRRRKNHRQRNPQDNNE